jgi:hypothetical protein
MSLPFYSTIPVSAAAAAQDSPASIAIDRALIALVRLARQAVRDWLAQPETTENGNADAISLSSAASSDERR